MRKICQHKLLPFFRMSTLPFYLVDAFVRQRPFTGNGAGVVLLPAAGGLDDAGMQAAAAEIKQVRLCVCLARRGGVQSCACASSPMIKGALNARVFPNPFPLSVRNRVCPPSFNQHLPPALVHTHH